jgi:hypothetical protein
MVGNEIKQPAIDPASTRVIVETIVGNKSVNLEKGTWNVSKGRIIDGNYNRLMILANQMMDLGMDVSSDVAMIMGATVGFSPKIPDYGMRGEAIQIITQQELPKTEKVREGGTGILQRAIQKPEVVEQ